MLLRSIRRMCDPLLEKKWRWRLYFLQVIWLFLAAETSPTVSGYFLGDIKAVLNGCEDHWTLQGQTSIPQLSQMTVCVNIQVVVPGHWVAFSYSSVRTPNPNLGLEGDDKAIYVWLLQVRHQFPFKISPMQWYKVCLRRDVQRNTFSLEVDYKIVAERTVIAQAIPPSGSLWLGCHQRRRTPEVAMGKVELYLFRMWADLGEHRSCEDGTVIGWNANHWEVTSPKAKETDPSLSCALKGGLGNVTGSSPGTPQVICDISQLCSNNSAYYWMSISVENETEFALNLVSKVFSCNRTSGETSTSNSNCINLFNDFPELELLQVEEVSCRENTTSNKKQTVCSVVLFLKHAISACDLQQYGEKALKSGSVQALITGNVERVGRNLCKDRLPPSDGFVKCMSNSSLDEICQSEERTKVKCSILQTNSVPSPQETTNSCNRSTPRYCDCSASCNTTSQLYAIKIKINNSTVTTDHLKHLLKSYASTRNSGEQDFNNYSDIFEKHKRTHLECHGVKNERLYSCMVILEMSQPVNYCSLRKLWQLIIKEKKFITSDGSPSRMMVCGGDPDLSNLTVVALNLTWSEVDLDSSHFCQPDPIRLECKANETLAVLLADSCPEEPETLSTFQPTTPNAILTGISTLNHTSQNTERKQTTSSKPSDRSTLYNFTTASNTLTLMTATVNFTGKTVSTTESVSTSTDTEDFNESSLRPSNNMTTETIAILSSSNKTENHKKTTVKLPTIYTTLNSTSVLTSGETTRYDTTTVRPSSSSLVVSGVTKAASGETSSNNVTADVYLSKDTTLYNVTTRNTFAVGETTRENVNNAINQSTKNKKVTTRGNESSPSLQVTSSGNNYIEQQNGTKEANTPTLPTIIRNHTSTSATPNNNTIVYNHKNLKSNYTTADKASTHSYRLTSLYTNMKPITNYTSVYEATIPSENLTAFYNATNHGTTLYNDTTPSKKETGMSPTTTPTNNNNSLNNKTTVYTATTPNNDKTLVSPTTTTINNNLTTVYTAITPNKDETLVSPTTTTINNNKTTVYTATTPNKDETLVSPTTTTINNNQTTVYNAITPNNNETLVSPATTRVNNKGNQTPMYNVATTKNNETLVSATTTMVKNSNNQTAVYNVKTPNNNLTLVSPTTVTINNNNNQTTLNNATTQNNKETLVSPTTITINNNNQTTVYNAISPRNNETMVTTPSNNTTLYNAATTGNNYTTLHIGSDPSIDHKTSYDLTTPSNSNITVYNATTQSYKETALSDTTIPSKQNTTVYNAKTGSNNHSTVYNAKPLTEHYTPVYNATTAKNNFTTGNNATTPQNNLTLVYNATTLTENLIPYNKTTNNFTTVYNTKTTNNYRTTNSASLNEKHTNEYNLTTVSSNYTTLNNSTTSIKKNYTTFTATAPSNNYTTVYNTTAITEKHLHNYNTTASSNNYTSVYNATSSNTKHTAVQNTTTPSNSYTTEQNVTAKNNHTTAYYATISSINMTTVHKPTMTSIHFTTNQNITHITSNFTNKYNATLFTTTSNTASPSKSSTTNMVGVQNTTALNYSSTLHPAINSSIIYTSVTRSPRNATTAFNISIAPVDPQQITTTLNINTTVVAALTEVGRTTKLNSTTESWTSLADNSTKPTQHSMLNQTGNRTTVTVTQMTTVYKNDSNLGAGFSTIQATKPLSSNLTKDTVSPFTATTVNTILTTHDPTKKSPVSSATKTTTLPSNKATMSTVTSTGNTLMTTMKTSTSTENKEEKANELLDQTEDVSKLNSSLVSNLVGNLEKLLESPSISQSVGKKVIDIISNLMNCDREILSGSTNRLIQLVDTLGLKLEVMGVSGMLSSTSLVLAIKTVDGTNFPETSVEIFNTDNVQLRSISRSRVKRSASALGSVNLPSSLTAGLLPEEKLQASRVQFTFYKNNSFFQDSSLDNQTVVSAVLGSSVANLSISNLKENITFTIRHMSLSLNDITSCVFWNFTKNNKAGGWDDNGCSVANTTAEHTTCSCNHLTSFAILLDMSREGITDPLQAKILSFITYIGCGISSVFLAVTLITHLLFEKLLRDIPAKILVQLCFSLLLLNLVFMLDGWLANYKIVNLCISTAFFLHYFLLSSFTWAGLEALHMYLSIVRVFTPYLSRYMLKFSLMGWGFPLIVVVIIIAVDKNNYGLVPYGKYEDGTTDDFCWLRNDIAFYVGVVAYFLLIFVLCLVVFIVVMIQLYRIKKQNPHNQSPNRSAMTDMRSIIGLVLLLGLTWGFALFAWGDAKLPFIYLFTIFNSLLGLFVFIFHCAVKENVRRMWRMYLCCGNLRLANNLEWSRTATHNNKQLSAATGTTSAQQLSHRSSSFASNLTNSSGSVFVDSGISDHSNSDVVLNEIQRRSVSPIDEP